MPVVCVAPDAFAEPLRLISLKPNITQSLMALGLSDKIVGITKFCMRPNPTAEIVGDYNSFDVEKIVRLKPDLVITSQENASGRDFYRLTELKIPTLLLNFDTWNNLLASLDELEKKISPAPQSPETVKAIPSVRLSQSLSELRTRAIPLKGKSFVVIVQRVPLMVAGGKSFISTLLTEAGLVNVFENSSGAYPTVDEEIFIREGPELVFELSHEGTASPEFLGQTVIPLKMEDFLASPIAVESLRTLVQQLLTH